VYPPAKKLVLKKQSAPAVLPADFPVHFIWVVGDSSVGKATLISKLVESPELGREFGLDLPMKPIHILNPLDRKAVSDFSRKSKFLLIYWQAETKDHFYELKEQRPDAEHVVLHLRCEQNEHIESYTKDFLNTWKLGSSAHEARRSYDVHHPHNVGLCEAYRKDATRFIDVVRLSGKYFAV
jgi:hypothetical protein